jgi:two-component system sensor histidine kinase KdpD
LKTALLNAVSHDLRTPLASVLASAESLRQPDVDWSEEERQDFLLTIEQEAQRLNNIVGNLLDLSRIQGGTLHPDRGWYEPGGLIADVVARLRARYPQHAFACDVPPDLPPVYLDPVEIDQVLTNLLDNAAKYSPTGTKIWLSAQRDERELRVQIADRGRGLPEEALRHLFTPFYRVPQHRSQPGPPGTGLGLAVARGLIEAHGGQIWAANRDGGGATFTFTLPLAGPDGKVAIESRLTEEQPV